MTAGVPFPYPEGGAEAFLAHDADLRQAARSSTFAITLDGALIGLTGLTLLTKGETGAEQWDFGYWLGVRWWGRGLTTEAGRAVLAHGANDLGLATLHSSCFVDNPASQRVLAKLGFAETGRGEAGSVARGANAPTIFYSLTLPPAA